MRSTCHFPPGQEQVPAWRKEERLWPVILATWVLTWAAPEQYIAEAAHNSVHNSFDLFTISVQQSQVKLSQDWYGACIFRRMMSMVVKVF